MSELADDQATDGGILLIAKICGERFIEVGDLGQGLNAIATLRVTDDVVFSLVEIVFVLDVPDDLLEHVLDGHHAGYAAIFIDDDSDVVSVASEFLKQHVKALGLWDEDRRTEHVANLEVLSRVIA